MTTTAAMYLYTTFTGLVVLMSWSFMVPGTDASCDPSCLKCERGTICTKRCSSGFYRTTLNTCKPCSDIPNCLRCSSSKNCYKCTVGYYSQPPICTKCPANCVSCKNATTCNVCLSGYYGNSCAHACPEHCVDLECTKARCTKGCKNGYYISGSSCAKCSSDCKDSKCDSDNGTCVKGCSSTDRYGSTCEHSCSTTLPSCLQCNTTVNTVTCALCKSGYFLNSSSCIPCSGNCKDGSECRHDDGTCFNGCKSGWTGPTCTDICPVNCATCTCNSCKRGFYGISCEKKCSRNCVATLKGSMCSKNDGVCVGGCVKGRWDPQCNKTCSDGCLNNICSQDQGLCYHCHPEKYGDQCNRKCSSGCIHPGNSSNVCRQSDGICVLGCSPGNQGVECSSEAAAQYRDESSNDNSMAVVSVLGAFVGIAVVVIIISNITLFICVRRRYLRKLQIVRERQPTNLGLEVINTSGPTKDPNDTDVAHYEQLTQRQGTIDGQYSAINPAPGTDTHLYSSVTPAPGQYKGNNSGDGINSTPEGKDSQTPYFNPRDYENI